MITAYIFIQFGSKDPVEVIKAIRKVEGVKQAHVVTGPADIIAFIEAEDMEKLELVVSKIRKMAVITSSDTRITWSI
ncbi:MAG: Lrp/AsnC ligand binding domain-containing protein [Dethiobacteria bacterium]|nr:Lrp/AsnC ligand binding domain-containing protein [Bacillota bacterium]MDW7729709.1 Lrp/AsnC ligand binding domain-containing protein [Bacillota bacterium]